MVPFVLLVISDLKGVVRFVGFVTCLVWSVEVSFDYVMVDPGYKESGWFGGHLVVCGLGKRVCSGMWESLQLKYCG